MLASGIRLVSVEHSSIDQCINEMIFFVVHIVKVSNVLVTNFPSMRFIRDFLEGRVKVAISFLHALWTRSAILENNLLAIQRLFNVITLELST